MPECGVRNPDYPEEPGCTYPEGHEPVKPALDPDNPDRETFRPDETWDHGRPLGGAFWSVPKPPADPRVGTVPEWDRTLLPFAVGPLKGVDPYISQGHNGFKACTMVAWGLYVGESLVAWDFVLGDSPKSDVARNLMRKWLDVRR